MSSHPQITKKGSQTGSPQKFLSTIPKEFSVPLLANGTPSIGHLKKVRFGLIDPCNVPYLNNALVVDCAIYCPIVGDFSGTIIAHFPGMGIHEKDNQINISKHFAQIFLENISDEFSMLSTVIHFSPWKPIDQVKKNKFLVLTVEYDLILNETIRSIKIFIISDTLGGRQL